MQLASTESPGNTNRGVMPWILVADDDVSVRSELSDYLRYQGLRVVEAEDGLAALEAIKRFEPCLIFLDVRMPGMDGISVAERAESLSPETKVVVMSGHTDEIRRSHLANRANTGAYWVLEKPFPLRIVGKFAQDICCGRAPTGGARQRAA